METTSTLYAYVLIGFYAELAMQKYSQVVQTGRAFTQLRVSTNNLVRKCASHTNIDSGCNTPDGYL